MNNPLLAVAIVFLTACAPVYGSISPRFDLEECAWNATDIVVAGQRDNAGTVTILETWKGKLAAGSSIQVTNLPIAPMQSHVWAGGPAEDTVTGKRMILFLVHGPVMESSDPRLAAKVWHGAASYGGTRVSVVWIEGDAAYAFEAEENPGPMELERLTENAAKFGHETRDILTSQEGMRKAMKIPDAAARAAALGSLAKSSVWQCRREAVTALGGCGRASLPLLHAMLHGGRSDQAGVVNAIAEAARSGAGEEMKSKLTAEAEFWAHAASDLPMGWWNNVEPGDRREELRNEYDLLSAALNRVEQLHYAPARDAVQRTRNLWASFPQLNEIGLNHISKACDAALKAIEAPPGNPGTGE